MTSRKSIEAIEKKFRKAVDPLLKKVYKLYGKEATIPNGEYKGRLGIVSNPHLSDKGIVVGIIRPYRLAGGDRNNLLWNHIDARTYWPLKDTILTNKM